MNEFQQLKKDIINMNEFQQLKKDIINQLENIEYNNGDLTDIGNEIGLAISKYTIKEDSEDRGYDLKSFIDGLEHGIESVNFELELKQKGFKSLKEFNSLISKLKLSDMSVVLKFKCWQNEDGTKEGLLKIIS
jgi:hypothetical protein